MGAVAYSSYQAFRSEPVISFDRLRINPQAKW